MNKHAFRFLVLLLLAGITLAITQALGYYKGFTLLYLLDENLSYDTILTSSMALVWALIVPLIYFLTKVANRLVYVSMNMLFAFIAAFVMRGNILSELIGGFTFVMLTMFFFYSICTLLFVAVWYNPKWKAFRLFTFSVVSAAAFTGLIALFHWAVGNEFARFGSFYIVRFAPYYFFQYSLIFSIIVSFSIMIAERIFFPLALRWDHEEFWDPSYQPPLDQDYDDDETGDVRDALKQVENDRLDDDKNL